MVATQPSKEIEGRVGLSSLALDLLIRQEDRKGHLSLNCLAPVADHLVKPSKGLNRREDFDFVVHDWDGGRGDLDDGSETLSSFEDVDRLVDFVKSIEFVSHEVLDGPLSSEGLVDKFRHILDAFPPSEGSSNPFPADDQLERVGGDKLIRLGHPDYATIPDTSVSSFQGLPHDVGVPSSVKGKLDAPFLVLKQKSFPALLGGGLVANISSELLGYFELLVVDINGVDLGGSLDLACLDSSQTDCPQSPDGHSGARPHIAGVHGCSPTCANSAANHADLVEVGTRIDLGS